MNRYPQLKSFLKDGEAESYSGITVKFVHGRTAILTIFQNGTKVEDILLHEIPDKPAMHKLFRLKGFVPKKSESSVEGVGLNVATAGVPGTTNHPGQKHDATSATAGVLPASVVTTTTSSLGGFHASAAIARLRAARRSSSSSNAAVTVADTTVSTTKSNARAERQRRRAEDREILGVTAPGYGDMVTLYLTLTAAVLAVGSYTGLQRRRRRRRTVAAALTR